MADTGLGDLKLYHFRQNNSGGHFVSTPDLDVNVFVEAHTYREANDLAEAVGVYFNGCSSGRDCSCCGDRWSPQWDESDAVTEAEMATYDDANKRVHRYADLMKRRYGGG